jgi:hypothetical protein
LSKTAVTPDGGSRAGAASKAATSSGDSDIVVRTHDGPKDGLDVEFSDTGLQVALKPEAVSSGTAPLADTQDL